MKRNTKKYPQQFLSLVTVIVTLLTSGKLLLAETYPQEVSLVSKQEARYDSPENGYAAIMSAMVSEDVEWYLRSLTDMSAQKERELYENGGGDLRVKFDLVKSVREVKILEKKQHKDGVFLLIEATDVEGSIMRGPSVFKNENGQWKAELNISPDDQVLQSLEYRPAHK